MFFVCMFSRSGLSFRIYCSLLLLPGIYVSVTNLVRCTIYMVGFRMFYFSVLLRIFPFFIGSSFIICFSFDENNAFGIVFFIMFFSYVFSSISSNIFSSRVFFILFPRIFLSVIVVIYLEISNSSAGMG